MADVPVAGLPGGPSWAIQSGDALLVGGVEIDVGELDVGE